MTAIDLTPFEPPEKPLSAFAAIRAIATNPIEAWPKGAYRQGLTWTSLFSNKALFVTDPALVKEVLVDRPDDFPKARVIRRAFAPALGESTIFTAEGATWRWQRRAAAPAFRHDLLLGLVPTFARVSRDCAEGLLAKAGETIDIAQLTTRVTFDVLVATLLSGEKGSNPARFARALDSYIEVVPMMVLWSILNLPEWLPHPGRAQARRAVAVLHEETGRVIASGRARAAPTGDLLDLLLAARDPETGKSLSDNELRDDILTFVAAGHETTAIALAWTLWLIDRHPEWRERVEAEIDHVVGDGVVTAEHIPALEITTRVVQESMRLFPPAPMIPRRAGADTMLGGEQVRAETAVYVPTYVIHRHEALWERPSYFEPDRFLPEAVKARHRCAYIPFAAGPRFCIGAGFAMIEMAAILATIMRRVRFRSVSDALPRPMSRMTLRPEGGIMMTIEAR